MPKNIDKTTAPVISLVPDTRNFEVVQGDNRAIMGIRFRDRISTADAPVYDRIHASQWRGHILRARGGTQNAPLQFNNVDFNYTSGGTFMASNREVQVHVPWEDPMLSTDMINPPPNRPVNLLYDIWQVTYPDATDTYVRLDGDLNHYSRGGISASATHIDRDSDDTVTIRVDNANGFDINDIVAMDFSFDGGTGQVGQYIIGTVTATQVASDPNTVTVRVITQINGGDEGSVVLPDPYAGTLVSGTTLHELTVTTNTQLSQNRFRGTLAVRERIYDNSHAGNEDVPTNGG